MPNEADCSVGVRVLSEKPLQSVQKRVNISVSLASLPVVTIAAFA